MSAGTSNNCHIWPLLKAISSTRLSAAYAIVSTRASNTETRLASMGNTQCSQSSTFFWHCRQYTIGARTSAWRYTEHLYGSQYRRIQGLAGQDFWLEIAKATIRPTTAPTTIPAIK